MINWNDLYFEYTETDYIVRSHYKDGQWSPLTLTKDKYLPMHVSASGLQYGQEAFEGLKAYRGADGHIRLFRIEDNAQRLQQSCQGICMPTVPTQMFIEAVLMCLDSNIAFVPPFESGASLYFRPLVVGTSPKIAVEPGTEYEFVVLATPVGPYHKAGFQAFPYALVYDVDRAAPLGTGKFKVGGNYAGAFRAEQELHKKGFNCLFLDAKYKRYIDECGAANFFGIRGCEYITPRSSSILRSITNDSIMTLAKDMHMRVIQRHIKVSELATFEEAGACGTAAIICPISKVIDLRRGITYQFGEGKPGRISSLLYQHLIGIQYGIEEDTHQWCEVVR